MKRYGVVVHIGDDIVGTYLVYAMNEDGAISTAFDHVKRLLTAEVWLLDSHDDILERFDAQLGPPPVRFSGA